MHADTQVDNASSSGYTSQGRESRDERTRGGKQVMFSAQREVNTEERKDNWYVIFLLTQMLAKRRLARLMPHATIYHIPTFISLTLHTMKHGWNSHVDPQTDHRWTVRYATKDGYPPYPGVTANSRR